MERFNSNACNCAVLAIRCVVTMSQLPYMQADSKAALQLVSILKQYKAAYNAVLLTKYWLNGIKLRTNDGQRNCTAHKSVREVYVNSLIFHPYMMR